MSCLAVLLSAVLFSTTQIAAGDIGGDVRDADGAPLPGAVIVVRERATNRTREGRSQPDGHFLIPALPPGLYDLSVSLPGYRTTEQPGVMVSTGETLSVAVSLAADGVEESVVVTARVSRIGTTGLGQSVSTEYVQQLPLNGRSVISLAALAPGVALPPGSSLPRINGGRPRTNEYLFDGIAVLQPEPGQVPFFPVVDAIQDFKIESNSPAAEFGRFNGGVVNLTTRSGGNDLSGRLFEFLRHEALNARNPFAAAGETPRFRRQQFGGVIGGPVVRNKTFFFADYQGQRQEISRTAFSTVPTALQRQGVFTEPIAGRFPAIFDPATTSLTGGVTREPFADATIPASRIDPVARTLLDRYPLPTRAGTANNFERADHETVDQDQFGVRLDQRLTDRGDRLFARLSGFRETFLPVTPLPEGSGATTGTLGPQRTEAWTFASSYQRAISSRVLNELRVGDTRRQVSRRSVELPNGAGVDLGLPGIPVNARFATTLPTFQIAGYQFLGSPANTATDFQTRVTQVADTFTWLQGRHVLKAGADLRWSSLDVVQPPSPTGLFQFRVQTFSIDLQQAQIRQRAHVQDYFVQDEWRVSDRITVNAGLRYTLNFPSSEQNNQAAVLDFTTRRLDYLGVDGSPRSARRLHYADFGPRLGISARLSSPGLLRAGYGRVFIEQAGITTPFTTPVFPFLQTASQRTIDNLSPAFVLSSGPRVSPTPLTPEAGLGQGVFAVNRELGSGYVDQWHAAWQREVGSHVLVEIAYVGSNVTRAGIPDANLNQLTVEQLALGAPLLERVPNPYLGIIPPSSSIGEPTIPRAQLLKPLPEYTTVSLHRNNVGTTRYRGFAAKVERRFSGGLSLLASYTRSRLVDDASSVFDASILTGPVTNAPVADAFDRRRDRDRSTGDIPHVFVASAVADLPWGPGRRWQPGGLGGALARGWTLTGILTLQSGTPVAVTQLTNFNAFAGFGTQRPNLIGDATLPSDRRSTARWFNTNAFSVAPQFTLGSSSRNPVRGPAYRNLDIAAARTLMLPRQTSIELRAEVFNLTNTPAWGTPNGVFGSPGFGSITSAGDPRVVQLGVRLNF